MTVYLLEAAGTGKIKIGRTSKAAVRIAAIQTACPFPISVLATREGGAELEKAMHRAAAENRCKGEWFNMWDGCIEWFTEFLAPELQARRHTSMCEQQAEIVAELETRAERVGVPIHTVCSSAGIAPSTFYRWKSGSDAKLVSIAAIQRELGRLEGARTA